MIPLLLWARAEKPDCNLNWFFQKFALIKLSFADEVLELLGSCWRTLILHVKKAAHAVIEENVKNFYLHYFFLLINSCIEICIADFEWLWVGNTSLLLSQYVD